MQQPIYIRFTFVPACINECLYTDTNNGSQKRIFRGLVIRGGTGILASVSRKAAVNQSVLICAMPDSSH